MKTRFAAPWLCIDIYKPLFTKSNGTEIWPNYIIKNINLFISRPIVDFVQLIDFCIYEGFYESIMHEMDTSQ